MEPSLRGSLSRDARVWAAGYEMISSKFDAGATRPPNWTGDKERAAFIRRFLLLRVRRSLGEGRLVLKPLRITDGPFMSKGFRNTDILRANVSGAVPLHSWIDVWWWLRKTYPLLYCIRADSKRIGFIGLFDIVSGESGEASLAIFNSADRRRGHGSTAFRVFSENLREYSLVKRIFVRIREDKCTARLFWSKLGFEESGAERGIRVMSLCLGNNGKGYRLLSRTKKGNASS